MHMNTISSFSVRTLIRASIVATGLGLFVAVSPLAALADLQTTSKTFGATGSDQFFTVPYGVTSLSVTLVGAGGGNASAAYFGLPGGRGGRTNATIDVRPGQKLKIIAGRTGAGSAGYAATPGGYGGGGNGYGCSGGGGRSAIRLSDGIEILTAGGGGGGGCMMNRTPGADGGGLSGANATVPSSYAIYGCTEAGGGTQTEGGRVSCNLATNAESGSHFRGGNVRVEGIYGGPGGGGGWFGGAGGHGGAGAGGGSGHCGGYDYDVSSCETIRGAGSPGGIDGSVIIRWNVPHYNYN